MSWKCENVREEPLPAASREEEYLLHDAALDWSLAESIVINSRDDAQSRPSWEGRVKPFDHQWTNLFTFCRRLPVTLLADDVGLGKTISAGLILSELMARKRVTRTLVVCPKILCQQWKEELDEKFGIVGQVALGNELNDQFDSQVPVVITTYESAKGRIEQVPTFPFDMLILDEAHKLRNLYGSPKPPAMAVSIRAALENRLFKYALMLTATPIHNRLWDLYSLIDCLTVAKGHQHPFGTPEEFRERYLMPRTEGRGLNPRNEEAFRRLLRQYIARTRRGDARLAFPKREIELARVNLTRAEQKLARLVASHIEGLSPLLQTSLAQAMMSSPPAVAEQLENMARKQPYLTEAARRARLLSDSCGQPAKLSRLLHLCNVLASERPADWRVVVFTLRKETQSLIGRELARRGIPVGFVQGGAAKENQRAIERFRADPPEVRALVSTDAGAEGINLQAANVLVNYDLPWNPMVVEQRIGRLQRLASKYAHVIIYNLVAAGSVEERVVARLMQKLHGIAQAIGDIESILESSGEDDDDRFENKIRDLVVRSLLGQDAETATRLAEESIDRARRQIEEQREEIDRTLGRLDDLHSTGLRMPKLLRVPPSISAQDFVLRARRAVGDVIRQTAAGVFEARSSDRRREVIVFDELLAAAHSSDAVFMGNVTLYQPGKAAFERLVQEWVRRCGHYVRDLQSSTAADAERLARTWCETIPEAVFLSCEISGREPWFQGQARVRVTASNGVDSYEKLITQKFHPTGHHPVEPPASSDVLTGELPPSRVLPPFSTPLACAVEADRDVAEFCRFYEARRAEEMEKAGADYRLRHKIYEDFNPSVVADIVGFRGVRYDQVTLQVRFSLRGEGEYAATLQAVPASGQILTEPERKGCERTNLRVPVDCLEFCQITSMLALKHLLKTSEASGLRALQEHFVTCQVTGKRVLNDETLTSAVSGTRAIKSEFVTCQQTNAPVLRSEAGESAVSGKVVRLDLLSPSDNPAGRLGLADEFGTCEVSCKRLLTDELAPSAVSGRRVNRGLLVPSDRSGKLALADELVTCEEKGARLLPEETGTCALTSKRVDARLLARSKVSGTLALLSLLQRCAVTGTLALPSELDACELTGSRVLPSELEVCAVTGTRALRSRMVRCVVTDDWVLASETGKSDYSGKTVAARLLRQSDRPPGRRGLAEEFGECSVTGNRLLLDELGCSAVSGRRADKALLRPSSNSGGLAFPEELVRCEESGAELLPAEVGRCEVTDKTVDSRLLTRSEVSDVAVLERLAERCAVTRKTALPSELVTCELTGARALPDQFETCSVTNKLVIRTRMRMCQKTGRRAVDTEFGRSAVSGLEVLRGFLFPSSKSPRRLGLADELAACEATGQRLLLDELGKSVVSGKCVDRDLLIPSDRSKALALAEELVTCQVSGARLLPSETGRCAITRKVVDSRLLSASDHSRRRGLTHLMLCCAITNKLVLPDEVEQCELTREWVLVGKLETCAVTGLKALPGELVRSDVSGKCVVPNKAVWSAVSGRVGLPEECVRCAWLEQPVLREEAANCALTGRLVARTLLNADGELSALRELLDGRARRASDALDLVSVVRSLDEGYFKGLSSVQVVPSPAGGKVAVCAEVRNWFGFVVRYVGFLLKTQGKPTVTGTGVIGYRSKAGWVQEDELTFS